MLYKYNGTTPIWYHDTLIIDTGDLIKFNGNSYHNITKSIDIENIPKIMEKLQGNLVPLTDTYATVEEEDFMDSIEKSNRFKYLGLDDNEIRKYNIGSSNYSKHIIQPWSIWLDYKLDPWDADIIKRVLRTKKEEGKTEIQSRIEDYQKIIHVCNEKIRQLKYKYEV